VNALVKKFGALELRGTPFKVLYWLLSPLGRGWVRGCGDGNPWLYSLPTALTLALPEGEGAKTLKGWN